MTGKSGSSVERNVLGFSFGKIWELFLYLTIPFLAAYFDSADPQAMALVVAILLGLTLVIAIRANRIFKRLRFSAKHGPVHPLFIHGGSAEDISAYDAMKRAASVGAIKCEDFNLREKGPKYAQELTAELSTATAICLQWGGEVAKHQDDLIEIIEKVLISHKERPFLIVDIGGRHKDDTDLRIIGERYFVTHEADASRSVMQLLAQSIQRTGLFVLISQYYRYGLILATVALLGVLAVAGFYERDRSVAAWKAGLEFPMNAVWGAYAANSDTALGPLNARHGPGHDLIDKYLQAKEDQLEHILADGPLSVSLWHVKGDSMYRVAGHGSSNIDGLPLNASLVGCACDTKYDAGVILGVELQNGVVVGKRHYPLRGVEGELGSGTDLGTDCSHGVFRPEKKAIMVASIRHGRSGGTCCVVSVSSDNSAAMIDDPFTNRIVQAALQECLVVVGTIPE